MEMKKVFTMMTALSLLAVLAGCGSSGSDGGPADSLPLTEVRSAQLDESLTLSAEWPSYDSLDATVYVVLENHGDETVTTGADFQLERDMGGGGEFSWYQLELKENVGWTAIEFVIPPGESMAFACPLSACETSFLIGGHFRIVKEAGGNRCAGSSPFLMTRLSPNSGPTASRRWRNFRRTTARRTPSPTAVWCSGTGRPRPTRRSWACSLRRSDWASPASSAPCV